MLEIHTDGACSCNPGPGGYGIVMIRADKILEISEGFRKTTNNRMELMAVIAALETVPVSTSVDIKIYSDSQYVVHAINKGWLKKWKKENFKGRPNKDLWLRLDKELTAHNTKIEFEWYRGDGTNRYNTTTDKLAKQATKKKANNIDEEYENG